MVEIGDRLDMAAFDHLLEKGFNALAAGHGCAFL
jgi:hypothetical protein